MPPALDSLQLVCFGPPAIFVNGRDAPREARWNKHLALLIYLSLAPRHQRSRDHLLGVFWAEKPDPKARHALNESVRRLRKALGAGRLRSEGDVIVLSADGLEVDTLRFAALVKTAPEEAVAMLSGDFLEGFHVKDAPEFDEWMARERQGYQDLAIAALVGAGEARLAGRHFHEAAAAARRALSLSSRSLQAITLLMRAKALSGEPAEALSLYKEFTDRLQKEANELPPPALAALAERIAKQKATAPGSRLSDGEVEPPLVGREAVHRAVSEGAAQGLVRGPWVMAITSTPGMGRSRLLAECARQLSIGGALVLHARCIEVDQDARLGVLRMLARAGLARASGLAGASPDSLAALASLAPALAERLTPRTVADVAEMGAVLTDVFGAVTDVQPLALLIDDAHWADGPSLASLSAALANRPGARVVLVLAIAEGVGAPSRELLRLQSEIGRGLPGSALRLDGLAPENVAELVAALAPWCTDETRRDRLSRRVMMESGGIPFIAVTLLAALRKAERLRADVASWPAPDRTSEGSWPFSVPSLLRHAVAVQLTELNKEQQLILGAASIGGDPFDIELIAHVAERPVVEVERALATCEARHLIQFAGGRYAFTAQVIAEVVRAECLIAGERRRLERRACDALGTRTDLPSRVLRVSLLAHAAPESAVSRQAMDVAREAAKAGMRGAARRALIAAERSLTAVPDSFLQQQLADLTKDVERSA